MAVKDITKMLTILVIFFIYVGTGKFYSTMYMYILQFIKIRQYLGEAQLTDFFRDLCGWYFSKNSANRNYFKFKHFYANINI